MASVLSMAPRINLLFVFLLLCHTICLPVYTNSNPQPEETNNELFKPVKVEPVHKPTGNKGDIVSDGITVNEIKSPFFVSAKNDVIVAAAEAHYTSSGEKYGIVAKYFKTKSNADWKTEDVKAMIEKWETQLATEDDAKTFSTVRAFALNAKRDEIYIFLLYITDNGDQEWNFKLFKGTVGDEGENTLLITWRTDKLNGSEAVKKIKESLTDKKLDLKTVDGSAFVIESEKIVFMVKGKSASHDEYVTAFFHLEEAGKKLEWIYDKKSTDSHSLFFQWENKIFKIPTNDPNDNSKKMMLFDAEKKIFENSSSTITRLQKFLKDKNNFVTAIIQEEKQVLLFTQEKENKDSKKNDLYLWMTDGTRVGYVGTIISGFSGPFDGSVLYTNDELVSLHQKYTDDGEEEKNNFCFKILQGQLSNIKKTLDAWNKYNNDKIKKLFEKITTSTTFDFTDGLVGFLHNTGENNGYWQDEYLNVNAKVKNGEKTANGFIFKEKGARALWPVKNQQGEQPYSFINTGFTILATVTVGSNKIEGGNSILGVSLTGSQKTVGLWCTTGGTWGVSGVDGKTETQPSTVDCKHEKTYYVAVILNNNSKLSVYVNGQKLKILNNGEFDITTSGDIENFYFGAEDDKTTDVTITNVLLYNRPFTTDEAGKLKPKQNTETDRQAIPQGNGSTLPRNNGNTEQTDNSSNTSPTKDNEEVTQSSSPPPTTEDSAARVGVVGVLCFMLFGVFTLLGRYVY